MTEPQETEPAAMPEIPVTFEGREMFVRMPRPEQLLVWQRTLKMLSDLEASQATWTGSEVMRALERCRKIVDSILVNKADIEWLDDQFLDGALDFRTLAPFINLVVDGFATLAKEETPNREAKRAVKKAARKKAAIR